MTFLPDLAVMLAYTAAAIILVITPGPDMTLFLGQTLTGGRARGIAAFLGASTGLVVHTMLAAFGLSALLAHSAAAFGVLKIGACAWRCGAVPRSPSRQAQAPRSRSVRCS